MLNLNFNSKRHLQLKVNYLFRMINLRAVNLCMAWPYSCYLAKNRREHACNVILAFPMFIFTIYLCINLEFFYCCRGIIWTWNRIIQIMHVEERAARRPSLWGRSNWQGSVTLQVGDIKSYLTISCKEPLKTTVAIIALLVQW